MALNMSSLFSWVASRSAANRSAILRAWLGARVWVKVRASVRARASVAVVVVVVVVAVVGVRVL
jgi:hypothetical protein